MNSSLAWGDVSAGGFGENETDARLFVAETPDALPDAVAPDALPEFLAPFVCVGAAAVVVGDAPGPRRRNSVMMSWPSEADSSSFRIVPVPVPSPTVAPSGLVSTTLKVSSSSALASPLTLTVKLFVVSAAAKVSVPEFDW